MLEGLRRGVVTRLLGLGSVSRSWPVWRGLINEELGPEPSVDAVLRLADSLGPIFGSTGQKGRGQGELSGGGAAWESLVAWYLNLVTVGTRSITMKRASDVPQSIRDALSVKFGPNVTNSEADLVAVTLPGSGYPYSIPDESIDSTLALSAFCHKHFQKLNVAVIQCKTNWNDNAQIPMLWDMIYSAQDFPGRNIMVGENAFSLRKTASFKYAFVTVPTTKMDKIKPNSTAVLRVSGLSGRNYWGHPSKQGVAESLKEIFSGAAIGPDKGTAVRESLDAALREGGIPEYFGLKAE